MQLSPMRLLPECLSCEVCHETWITSSITRSVDQAQKTHSVDFNGKQKHLTWVLFPIHTVHMEFFFFLPVLELNSPLSVSEAAE